MTRFTASQNHINTLIAHGAMLRSQDDGSCIPLTLEFYRSAVASCKRMNCLAMTFSLSLPGIDEDLELAVWKDGHVDSGSPEGIRRCLDR